MRNLSDLLCSAICLGVCLAVLLLGTGTRSFALPNTEVTASHAAIIGATVAAVVSAANAHNAQEGHSVALSGQFSLRPPDGAVVCSTPSPFGCVVRVCPPGKKFLCGRKLISWHDFVLRKIKRAMKYYGVQKEFDDIEIVNLVYDSYDNDMIIYFRFIEKKEEHHDEK